MKRKLRDGLEKVVELGKNIGRAIKKNGKIVIVLGALAFGNYNNVYGSKGAIAIENQIYSLYTNQIHDTVHSAKPGVSDGYDNYDHIYHAMFDPSGINSKIVSIVEEETEKKELDLDIRPLISITPVNLELAIHKRDANRGDPVKNIQSKNELWCSLPLIGSGYDFGSKSITYWERDANDPNVYYLVANVRKEIAQHGGIIPLPDLNGTYGSEVPYLYAQIRFNDHFVHLNDDNIVDFKDFAIFANAYGRKGITDINRADSNDLGAQADYDLDGDVDVNDLNTFTDYYLTSKTYHLEDGWIIE